MKILIQLVLALSFIGLVQSNELQGEPLLLFKRLGRLMSRPTMSTLEVPLNLTAVVNTFVRIRDRLHVVASAGTLNLDIQAAYLLGDGIGTRLRSVWLALMSTEKFYWESDTPVNRTVYPALDPTKLKALRTPALPAPPPPSAVVVTPKPKSNATSGRKRRESDVHPEQFQDQDLHITYLCKTLMQILDEQDQVVARLTNGTILLGIPIADGILRRIAEAYNLGLEELARSAQDLREGKLPIQLFTPQGLRKVKSLLVKSMADTGLSLAGKTQDDWIHHCRVSSGVLNNTFVLTVIAPFTKGRGAEFYQFIQNPLILSPSLSLQIVPEYDSIALSVEGHSVLVMKHAEIWKCSVYDDLWQCPGGATRTIDVRHSCVYSLYYQQTENILTACSLNIVNTKAHVLNVADNTALVHSAVPVHLTLYCHSQTEPVVSTVRYDYLFNVSADCPSAQVMEQTLSFTGAPSSQVRFFSRGLFPRTLEWLRELLPGSALPKAEKIFREYQMAGFADIQLPQLRHKVDMYHWTRFKEVLTLMTLGSFPFWFVYLVRLVLMLFRRLYYRTRNRPQRPIPPRPDSPDLDNPLARQWITMDRVRVLQP